MATEQERKDKVKAEDLQKAVILALQTVEDVRCPSILSFLFVAFLFVKLTCQELARICREVESMKLYDDIKDKEPQTRMILDLQKVRFLPPGSSGTHKQPQCLAMYPKGTQKYVAPSYADITDEKMRNYKKILHQSQWEVQSKLSVIKVRWCSF